MTGHLDVVCGLDDTGRSQLTRQSFRAPMHLSKPFHDGGALVVNVVNQTAGLFAGDEIVCRAEVEPGAHLVLTSPSASRAHRMATGEARTSLHLRVAAGGWLEVLPELFIPQAGSRHRQRTEIDVAGDGELIFWESLAPGRTASGETFAFQSLEWETDIRLDGRAILRERYRLTPGDDSLAALCARFPASYFACCVAVSRRLESADLRPLASASEGVLAGASPLVAGGWIFKILAEDSPALRGTIQRIRRDLHAILDRPMPMLRRV